MTGYDPIHWKLDALLRYIGGDQKAFRKDKERRIQEEMRRIRRNRKGERIPNYFDPYKYQREQREQREEIEKQEKREKREKQKELPTIKKIKVKKKVRLLLFRLRKSGKKPSGGRLIGNGGTKWSASNTERRKFGSLFAKVGKLGPKISGGENTSSGSGSPLLRESFQDDSSPGSVSNKTNSQGEDTAISTFPTGSATRSREAAMKVESIWQSLSISTSSFSDDGCSSVTKNSLDFHQEIVIQPEKSSNSESHGSQFQQSTLGHLSDIAVGESAKSTARGHSHGKQSSRTIKSKLSKTPETIDNRPPPRTPSSAFARMREKDPPASGQVGTVTSVAPPPPPPDKRYKTSGRDEPPLPAPSGPMPDWKKSIHKTSTIVPPSTLNRKLGDMRRTYVQGMRWTKEELAEVKRQRAEEMMQEEQKRRERGR